MTDKFHYSLLKYLKNLAEQKNDSTLQTGVEYLATYFNMDINEENTKTFGDHDLQTIFLSSIGEKWSPELEKNFANYKTLLTNRGYFKDVKEGSKEYEERLSKARDRFFEKYSQEKKTETKTQNTNNTETETKTKTETETKTEKPKRVFKTDVSEEQKKEAEALKNKGNEFFKNQDFDNAIKCYSDAIEIYSSAIYYCNRGTSYGKLGKHNEALEDLLICVEIDPKYVRGYDRLGCTYMRLNNYPEAVRVFQEGLLVDPNYQDIKTHLQEARQYLEGDMGGMGENQIPGMPGVPGMPNMDQLQNMLGNMGPMQDMLQNNPQIMNMAMNLMNDPNFQQTMMNMMNNPGMSELFGQMMGGQGGQGGQGGGTGEGHQ
jgi:small glutamine-rich tetratricopeptide repeat-containing protein alpha